MRGPLRLRFPSPPPPGNSGNRIRVAAAQVFPQQARRLPSTMSARMRNLARDLLLLVGLIWNLGFFISRLVSAARPAWQSAPSIRPDSVVPRLVLDCTVKAEK